jgi:HSP20 family molecular chaperone IbpA
MLLSSGSNPVLQLFNDDLWFSKVFAPLPTVQQIPYTDAPVTEYRESGTNITIDMEVPGWEASELEVTTAVGNQLVVGGKRKDRRTGAERSFKRVFTLPKDAQGNASNVTLKNGILTIVVPKVIKKEEKSIKIPISITK